jgi:hypothetical protein
MKMAKQLMAKLQADDKSLQPELIQEERILIEDEV